MGGKLAYLNIKQVFDGDSKDKLASLILFFFLLSENIDIILHTLIPASLFGFDFATVFENLFLVFFIILYYIFLNKSRGKKTRVWPIYLFIIIFILGSVTFYPEYYSWFFHEEYGLNSKHFQLCGGIFALLYVSMVDHKTRLASLFIYSARINLLFYIIQFLNAIRRGYWISAFGTRISYSLTFGYRVAIVASLFLVLYYLNRSKIDLISFLISLVMIILQGSRGALGCIISTFFLLAIFYFVKTRKQTIKKQLGKALVISIFLVSFLGLFSVGASFSSNLSVNSLRFLRIDYSRSIQLLLEGRIDDGSGRERIWDTAGEAIQNEVLLGYGFYGDRNIIGKKLIFGYPHNFILEVFLQFGVPLGIVFVLFLFWNIIKMGRKCNDVTWWFLYIFLLSSCSKLLLSDSFWYYWPFLALIGVLCIWRQQDRYIEN